jgi:hypothetical protein
VPLTILGSAVDTWATVFVAIGTVGAVAYALFRDLVVVPRRRPKLELRFDRDGTDQVVVEASDDVDAATVRLRVANGAGKDTADDVVVMVTEVRRLEEGEDGLAEVRPLGLPLTWSGSNPPLTVASVHPGSERHVGLLHVDLPAPDRPELAQSWPDTVPARLDVSPKPARDRELLQPAAYEISVEVRARNADAVCYLIPVRWDGEWSTELWEHLRVEQPRQVAPMTSAAAAGPNQ